MEQALIIGGTRFIGRHLVSELLDHGYDVTLFNRGNHVNPFADRDAVDHIVGDRQSSGALENARDAVDPDLVVDCVAYYPGEVRMATEVFAEVDAYVYISSGAAYGPDVIPKREDETPLEPCSDAQAVDESPGTYGARKAEGDRAIFEAAEEGVRAMSVRPPIVYGPYDYTGRFGYWVDRISEYDRVLVPGDGTNIHHLVAVENVAHAIRTVAEKGAAGEAYNAANPRVLTLGELLESIASALHTDVTLVTASARELGELELTDFPLYNPNPHVLGTAKLAALGWNPVDVQTTIEAAVQDPSESERDPGPVRSVTATVLDRLD
jgi:nucleoside-diphosphate-sugar epimerase